MEVSLDEAAVPQVKTCLAWSPACRVVRSGRNQPIHDRLSEVGVHPIPLQLLHGLVWAVESSRWLVKKRLAGGINVAVGAGDSSTHAKKSH